MPLYATCNGNDPQNNKEASNLSGLALIWLSKGPWFNYGPGLILGSWIMIRHISCILLIEWSTTSQRLCVYRISVPYAHKNPIWSPIPKSRGANPGILIARLNHRW